MEKQSNNSIFIDAFTSKSLVSKYYWSIILQLLNTVSFKYNIWN